MHLPRLTNSFRIRSWNARMPKCALRRSEERFRRLAENAPDIIYRYELIPQRRFSYVSPGVELITGHTPDEYYSNPDLCFHLVASRGLCHSSKGSSCTVVAPDGRSASPFPAIRWLHQDGSVVWTEEHTVPMWDEFRESRGRWRALPATSADARRWSRRFRPRVHQLEGIVEFLPDATFVIDRQRKVVAWNRAIEEMTGTGKGDILGKGDHSYAIPFYGEARPLLIDLVLSRNEEYEKKYEYCADPKVRPSMPKPSFPCSTGEKGAYLWITASPLYGGDGNLIGAIESIRDVTDHKMLEDALRTNAEKIKRFAYSVSHDLKSPIIGINGITRLLHKQYRDFLDERGRGLLRSDPQSFRAGPCTHRRDQRVTSRPRRSRWISSPSSPRTSSPSVRNEFEALLSIRHIQWMEPETIPTIRADRVSILRVLRNLVDNALKYGGEDLRRIKIGYGSTDEYHILSRQRRRGSA